MKKHEDFAAKNTAENYVLGNLSKKDEILFEEHLLMCDICADDVKKLSETANLLEQSILSQEADSIIPMHKKRGNTTQLDFYLKIAAGVAILAALSWFTIWYFGSNARQNIASNNKEIKPVEKVIPTETDTLQPENVIASNLNKEKFLPLERFESQINQVYRSISIDNVSPGNGKKFKTTDLITFQWKKQGDEILTLMIYNNKGENIFQKELITNSISKKISEPGLYYWQLETEEDIAYTGKFLVTGAKSGTK